MNDLDASDTSDTEIEDGFNDEDSSMFYDFCRTIVQDPLLDDGCNGEASLIHLLSRL